jgi:cytidylate kinase
MLIGIIGENCSGKSTLAEKIRSEFGAEVVSGKDYLRMAKSGSEAVVLFKDRLKGAIAGENLIYVISEPEQAEWLPEGAVRVLVEADLDTIKERFKARMHGNLPVPVAQMLERKHGMFDSGSYDYVFDGVSGDAAALCEAIRSKME